MSTHIALAATVGPKAGFKAFESVASKSGLPQVKKAWKRYATLNAKGRFTLYCADYGTRIDEFKAANGVAAKAVKATTTSKEKVMTAREAIAAEIAALSARLDALDEVELNVALDDLDAEPVAAPKAKAVKSAASTFSMATLERKGITPVKGRAFTYKGKRGSSKWVVTSISGTTVKVNRAA